MSSWCVVCMTSERWIAIWFPFKKEIICTVRNALLTIIITFVIISASQLFRWFFVEKRSDFNNCVAADEYISLYLILHIYVSQLVFQFTLPCGIVLILNLSILYRIHSSNIKRSVHRQNSASITGSVTTCSTNMSAATPGIKMQQTFITTVSRTHSNTHTSSRLSYRNKTTIMLLCVSFMFLLTFLPIMIISCLIHITMLKDKMAAASLIFDLHGVMEVCELLFEVNFACNFYIYVMSNAKFQQQFVDIMKSVWHRLIQCNKHDIYYRPPMLHQADTTL